MFFFFFKWGFVWIGDYGSDSEIVYGCGSIERGVLFGSTVSARAVGLGQSAFD